MPLIVVGLFLLLLIVNNVIKNAYYEETERTLVNQAEIFSTFISINSQGNFNYQEFCDEYGQGISSRITIIDKRGFEIGRAHV